jgi:acetyltransferase-like isoleucine patch superfamily enzyme
MKKLLARLISKMPLNSIRVNLYRLLGYKIASGARIGFGTVIFVRHAVIGRSIIRHSNHIFGPMEFHLGDGTRIGAHNEIHCVAGFSSGKFEMVEGSSISSGHVVDATGGVKIGAYTRVAGRASQFWTHGGQRKRTDILIGERCYIGSAVRFSQGVTIGDNCFVGLSATITKSFPEPDCLIAGFPATVVKRGITARLSLRSSQTSSAD